MQLNLLWRFLIIMAIWYAVLIPARLITFKRRPSRVIGGVLAAILMLAAGAILLVGRGYPTPAVAFTLAVITVAGFVGSSWGSQLGWPKS